MKLQLPLTFYFGFPCATAKIAGGNDYPTIRGTANFYQVPTQPGIFVEIELSNLPVFSEDSASGDAPSFLGFHLHENGDCSNNLANTGSHYNPQNALHPHHLGDFPSLLNNHGVAYMAFYDQYLTLEDISNRSLIIHSNRDDFTSQPSGDSGEKIACGVIVPVKFQP